MKNCTASNVVTQLNFLYRAILMYARKLNYAVSQEFVTYWGAKLEKDYTSLKNEIAFLFVDQKVAVGYQCSQIV